MTCRVRLLAMAARGVSVSGFDVRAAEVEKLIESPVLHGSGSLCRLLHYLANRAIHDPGSAIREHEIASEVFGRVEAFDPRLDSTVRVNVARLRAKLIDYSTGPGAETQLSSNCQRAPIRSLFSPGAWRRNRSSQREPSWKRPRPGRTRHRVRTNS